MLQDTAGAAAIIDAAAEKIGNRFRLHQTFWVAEPTSEQLATARADAVTAAIAAGASISGRSTRIV